MQIEDVSANVDIFPGSARFQGCDGFLSGCISQHEYMKCRWPFGRFGKRIVVDDPLPLAAADQHDLLPEPQIVPHNFRDKFLRLRLSPL